MIEELTAMHVYTRDAQVCRVGIAARKQFITLGRIIFMLVAENAGAVHHHSRRQHYQIGSFVFFEGNMRKLGLNPGFATVARFGIGQAVFREDRLL